MKAVVKSQLYEHQMGIYPSWEDGKLLKADPVSHTYFLTPKAKSCVPSFVLLNKYLLNERCNLWLNSCINFNLKPAFSTLSPLSELPPWLPVTGSRKCKQNVIRKVNLLMSAYTQTNRLCQNLNGFSKLLICLLSLTLHCPLFTDNCTGADIGSVFPLQNRAGRWRTAVSMDQEEIKKTPSVESKTQKRKG